VTDLYGVEYVVDCYEKTPHPATESAAVRCERDASDCEINEEGLL